MSRFCNLAMLYLGWFACVLGAAHGRFWLGPLVAGALLLAHLAAISARGREARLILFAGAFGFALDSSLASAGLFAFTGTRTAPWLSPPWMVALWMLFAATLNGALSWLAGRYGVGAVLGAIGGPMSYWAGARLGAIDLPDPTPWKLVGIGAAWAFAMPALLLLRDRVSGAPAERAPRGAPRAGGISESRHPAETVKVADSVGRTRAALLLAAFLVGALRIPPSVAKELEGVQFADLYRRGEVTMQLNCVALLRYKVLFRAYVAALYLGDGVDPEGVLGDVPKRLELSYFWSISGSRFGEAGDEILARNVDAETLARLRPRLDRLNALYQDVKPGDRYALTYVPGVGTELALNGGPLGIVDGADFSAAYFRIWLGEHPLDAELRDRLLNCSAPDAEDRRAANRAP